MSQVAEKVASKMFSDRVNRIEVSATARGPGCRPLVFCYGESW